LILAGEEDNTVASEEILEAYGTVKYEKQLEWLKDCGHWTCVEQGDVVAERIKRFMWTCVEQGDVVAERIKTFMEQEAEVVSQRLL